MINLMSEEELALLPVVILPTGKRDQGSGIREERHEVGCHRCEAFRPEPQLSGNLSVDPEIMLPSPGLPVQIAMYYNGASAVNGPFGAGRTISPNLTAQASGSP